MDDAKKSGDKGFGVRKELLLMVGKKLGFIAICMRMSGCWRFGARWSVVVGLMVC